MSETLWIVIPLWDRIVFLSHGNEPGEWEGGGGGVRLRVCDTFNGIIVGPGSVWNRVFILPDLSGKG